MEATESTNYLKFQTGNPVVRRLIDRLYATVAEEAATVEPGSVLDAGCGEGETLVRLAGRLPERTRAVDVSPEAVELTRRRCPGVEVSTESILSLPFEDGAFDLVFCLEVLEHIPDPGRALAELRRVTAGDLIVSVPHEPWFRLGSLARGKYLSGLGNHPEHVNHWNTRSLPIFLSAGFEVVSLRHPFPWLVAHSRARPGSPAR